MIENFNELMEKLLHSYRSVTIAPYRVSQHTLEKFVIKIQSVGNRRTYIRTNSRMLREDDVADVNAGKRTQS